MRKRTRAGRSEGPVGLPPPKRGSARVRYIVVDTREKLPFRFKGYKTRHAALDVGDYSVTGYEGRVAVERKSPEDMVNTLMVGRDRFARELERAASLDRFIIIVESSMAGMLMSANGRTSATPRVLISRLADLGSRHGVSILFCDSRHMAEVACLETLRPFLA